MNKTTTLVGFVSGLSGAAIAYAFKSRDTIHSEGVTKCFEPNLNILSPHIRISENAQKFETAIKKSRELVRRFNCQVGNPGLVIGVSVDGSIIWEEGNKI